jgi:hypothetical protein
LPREFARGDHQRNENHDNQMNQRNQMSAQDMTDGSVTEEVTEHQEEQNSDLLASKLSKELNNWRRRRTTGGRPRHDDGGLNAAFKTESARTIKVRGHETLVVRKPKLGAKPSATTDRHDD